MAKDEILAGAAAALKSLVSRVPFLGEALNSVEAYRAKQREKAALEFRNALGDRLAAMEEQFSTDWLNTPDGEMFSNKILESALDAQMADKRDMFVNALVNGARIEAPIFEKTKFVDLLRSLSRDALDVLYHLHVKYGPIVRKPESERPSTFLEPLKVTEELAPVMKWDPFRIESAYSELGSSGLFSSTQDWYVDSKGQSRPRGTIGSRGEAYTKYTERFVEFIKNPTTD